MVGRIYLNEWRRLLRHRLLRKITLLFVLSLLIVTWFGQLQNQVQIEAQKEAHQHIRAQWDEMEPSNPHRAAHFGSYAFKSVSVLSSIDEGINSTTGNVLRLEGHTQNEMMFAESTQSSVLSRFGKLKPSLVLQYLIPLLLIFLSFDAYPNERMSGRLKLLVNQGVRMSELVFGKVGCIWTIGLILLVVTLVSQVVFDPESCNVDHLFRLSTMALGYAAYYLVVINLTVLFSIWFQSATASMSIMMTIWICWTVFLPMMIGNFVEQMLPLPTRIEFQEAMSLDRSEGLDGHNPSDVRKQLLEEATLKKYGVESLEELPINFAGIVMQADEEYGNAVWDKHFGALYVQLEEQKNIVQLTGLMNPFISVQSISIGSAGTDMYHHLDFLRQAEDYRRIFIKTLNDEYAFGGSKTGERGWKADTAFFQSVKDFSYNQPTLVRIIHQYLLDIASLLFWCIGTLFVLSRTSKRASVL